MRTLTFILAASALVLAAAGPALAACDSTQIVQVGANSGDPEKDTIGAVCGPDNVERTSSIARTPRGEILKVGASTGEAEKDTLGYLHAASAQ